MCIHGVTVGLNERHQRDGHSGFRTEIGGRSRDMSVEMVSLKTRSSIFIIPMEKIKGAMDFPFSFSLRHAWEEYVHMYIAAFIVPAETIVTVYSQAP